MSTLDNWAQYASWCYRVIAKPIIDRSGRAAQVAHVAALRTAGRILDAIRSGFGGTLKELGDSEARKIVARNDAEVEKAKAAANANRIAQVEKAKADRQRYEAQVEQAKAQREKAEADMATANVERFRNKTKHLEQQEADRQRLAQIEAWERLQAALSKTKLAGGNVLFDEENLRQIMQWRPADPSNDDEEHAAEQTEEQ